MVPRRTVNTLVDQSITILIKSIHSIVCREIKTLSDGSNRVTEFIRPKVKNSIKKYLCETLPSELQTKLISKLIYRNNMGSPHFVLDLLFTERLKILTFELTKPYRCVGGSNVLFRVSEEDISRCLKTLNSVLENISGDALCLEQLYILDKSQDPDFQGDPINNMANTNLSSENRVGDWAGIMITLCSLSGHLAVAPNLTHVVLPFASDQILENIGEMKNLILFQNVYRSTVTQVGILALAEGNCRKSITHIVLSLNTHALIPPPCIARLLLSAAQLRVLEFGGSCQTKSLYFQVNINL